MFKAYSICRSGVLWSRLSMLLITITIAACAAPPPAPPRVAIEGSAQHGALIRGTTEPGTSVEVNSNAIRVDNSGRFVFGLGRDGPATVTLRLTGDNSLVSQRLFEIPPRQYRIQHIRGVPPRTVNPSAEDLQRIIEESKLLKQARSFDSDQGGVWQDFQWPVIGPITGVFGSRRVYDGQPRRPHYGVDIAVPTGTAIKAPASGIVTLAHPNMFFTGGTIVVDHGSGIFSLMAHLSRLLVTVGQSVAQGEPIGEAGATGRATGSHLHWQINWFQLPVDALLEVPAIPAEAE